MLLAITRVFANTPADSRIGYETEQISELMRLKSDKQVQVQRARFDRLLGVFEQPAKMMVGVAQFELAERDLLGDQPLRRLQIAIQEHGDRQLQIDGKPRVQIADLAHAGAGERKLVLDLSLRDVEQAGAR